MFTERHFKIFRCSSLALGPTVGDYALTAMEQAVRALRIVGVPTELIKTSVYSENHFVSKVDPTLDALCLQAKYEPEWCDAKHNRFISFRQNWLCKHNAAVVVYFLSARDPPSPLEGSQRTDGSQVCLVPSASCTDDELVDLLRSQRDSIESTQRNILWHQSQGRSTVDPEDDTFSMETKSMSNSEAEEAAVGPSKQNPVLSSSSPRPVQTLAPSPAQYAGSSKPLWQRALSAALGIAGIGMLLYGLTPPVIYVVQWCCGKHSQQPVQMSDEDSDDE